MITKGESPSQSIASETPTKELKPMNKNKLNISWITGNPLTAALMC